MKTRIVVLSLFINISTCRDFYVGMFKKNDLLVAQDRIYKEKVPFSFTQAQYGRYFTCPITYFRVVDRLGIGRGPRVQIIRGGLQKKYLVLRLTASYNLPMSVNIYVGCRNNLVTTKRTTTTTANKTTTTVKAEAGETSTSTGEKSSPAEEDKKAEGEQSLTTTAEAAADEEKKDDAEPQDPTEEAAPEAPEEENNAK